MAPPACTSQPPTLPQRRRQTNITAEKHQPPHLTTRRPCAGPSQPNHGQPRSPAMASYGPQPHPISRSEVAPAPDTCIGHRRCCRSVDADEEASGRTRQPRPPQSVGEEEGGPCRRLPRWSYERPAEVDRYILTKTRTRINGALCLQIKFQGSHCLHFRITTTPH
jgi:hypothetical protein